jgi:hypothetical protein
MVDRIIRDPYVIEEGVSAANLPIFVMVNLNRNTQQPMPVQYDRQRMGFCSLRHCVLASSAFSYPI